MLSMLAALLALTAAGPGPEAPRARPGSSFDNPSQAFILPPLPESGLTPESTRSVVAVRVDQPIEPIDLISALRLAGARDLDIAIARERVLEALAEVSEARALWLPSLYLGPNWIRHDGQAQVVEGGVKTISKSSLFLGGTAAGGSSVSGPVPAGGPAQVSGLTTVLRFSDAIFLPLAARQVARAREAGIQTATQNALFDVSMTYLDLQRAAGRIVIAQEAVRNAEALVELTASYARSGVGLEADHRRGLTERDRRRSELAEAVGDLEVASAELARRLRLNPTILLAPVEPPATELRLVSQDVPLDDLIIAGLRQRPELAEARALVDATVIRLRQARLRPLIPSLAFRYSGGGFGGGTNAFFGDFASRSDADVNLYWEIQNLGFGDRAIARKRASQQRATDLELFRMQDRVASEVVAAESRRKASNRQRDQAQSAVPEAVESLRLNFDNIRRAAGLPGATRPLEVLQPIQALAQVRVDYLDAVLASNRAQFQLFRAIGQVPVEPGVPPSRHQSSVPAQALSRGR